MEEENYDNYVEKEYSSKEFIHLINENLKKNILTMKNENL